MGQGSLKLGRGLLAAIGLCGGLAVSGQAHAQTCSTEQIMYANTGGFNQRLLRISPTGVIDPVEVPLLRDYGDIAVSADGNTIYGIWFTLPPDPPRLSRINQATGAEDTTLVLTGPGATDIVSSQAQPNGLSVLAGNRLLLSAAFSDRVYEVDPISGNTEIIATYPPVPTEIHAGPADFSSAGDFVQLNNGDMLALVFVTTGTPPVVTFETGALIRIRPNGTGVVVGELASTTLYGMARLGDTLYLFDGATGGILSLPLASLPASGTGLLTPTLVATTGRAFYGAASSGDSGYLDCATQPIPVTGPGGLVLLAALLAVFAWRRQAAAPRRGLMP